MESRKSGVWILLFIAAVILFSSSYISVYTPDMRTPVQNSFEVQNMSGESISDSSKVSLVQIVTEGGMQTPSSANCIFRLNVRDREKNNLIFDSIYAILFKVAVIPSFLITGSVFGTELKSIAFQKRILYFIHDADGKK